jgi:eukaryotic-like serine/threonine-protein kinase
MSKPHEVSEQEWVRVNEAIPAAGEHQIDAATLEQERIPTPEGLLMYPELGSGVSGCVHPAVDRKLLRTVAVKRLRGEWAVESFYRDGFIAEAQITGQLEHPNIVPVHELAISDQGVPYFTMKLVDGLSFRDWLRLPRYRTGTRERLHEGLEILLKVCDGIAYAHSRGVVHRDLKPDNIMIGTFGQVYVMDWGLARLTKTKPASGEYAQMEADAPVGTPYYMSPEQARGISKEMDERTDVFCLGAIMYQVVSGRVPYGNTHDVDKILGMAIAGQTIPIDHACRNLSVSPRIRAIISKAIAADPDERYQTASELKDDVQRFLRGGQYLPSKVFAPGEVILTEGETGEEAYMITRGNCRAFRTVAGEEEELGTMGTGEVFGEMALLLFEPRAATVVAIDEVHLLVLDKQTMRDGLDIDGWTGALVRALAQRFSDLEQQVRASGLRGQVKSDRPARGG